MFLSLIVNVIAIKTRIPFSVLLVIAGSLLVPLSDIDVFSFVTSFQLTPELLFFVFLPILIFESAYNIKIRNIRENKVAISLLAILGLLVSTFLIGVIGHWAFQLLGLDMPLMVTLLFGAIISATDPVAVLALFKVYGAPHRLTLIFEGESLFNDGTAFAVFLVFLDIMLHGYNGAGTILEGVLAFSFMMIGGVIFGLFMGFLFSKLIGLVKGQEHLEMTMTLLVAHFTFLLAELISEKWVISGHPVHISSIIATTVSSLVMGNYGRFKMSPQVEEYMNKFWSYFAFLANSLVFILMGLLFTSLSISLHVFIWPILAIIVVVVIARATSIYFTIGIGNLFKSEESVPMSWQHLLAWGSLRGSLAVIMALLIPDDMTLPNWDYSFSIKEFIIMLTIGSIYFTLLFKAVSIGKVIRWLKIDELSLHEKQGYYKSKALIFKDTLTQLKKLYSHHDVSKKQYEHINLHFKQLYNENNKDYKKLGYSGDSHQLENLLRIYTLGLEKIELKEIFRRGEIDEVIYKEVLLVLETQLEKVERDESKLKSLNKQFSTWFDSYVIIFIRRILFLSVYQEDQRYLYYRTQYKLIAKVLQELVALPESHLSEIFNDERALKSVISIYQSLKDEMQKQMQKELQINQALLDEMNEDSAKSLLHSEQNSTLDELHDNEIITSKLYVILKNELNP